jgi:anti-sigma factor RsiW
MKITREVIIDLLPLYVSGEASAATRELVDEYLKQDPELAERVRAHGAEELARSAPAPPPELELRSLHRTRRLIAVQVWLCGFASMFTAIGLALRIQFHDGRIADVHFVVFDHPEILGPCLGIALILWIAYFTVRRRLSARAL